MSAVDALDQFSALEAKTGLVMYLKSFVLGVRTVWSTLVTNPEESKRIAVPNAFFFSPLKPLEEEQIIVNEKPTLCDKCGAVFSFRKFGIFY
jgi:hypothetical protein